MTHKDWQIKGGKKTIQFSREEVRRLNPVLKRISQRKEAAFASFNQALKELLGLTNIGLVTEQDRKDILSDSTTPATNGEGALTADAPMGRGQVGRPQPHKKDRPA